jgi:integral membrane protein (TIGR01906 family)
VGAGANPRGGVGGHPSSRYHLRVIERLGRPASSVLVGIATGLVILAVAILPFVNPVWVSFEQGRARAAAWTGYSPAQLQQATNAILSDLVVGPPNFDVAVAGQPVLNDRERAHMADVRRVLVGLALLAGVSLVVLVVAHRLARGSGAFWRPVRAGAAVLAVGVLVVGVVGMVAFDAAFEVFHQLFFAGGTYTFDARTDRLVQLFPDQFWFETALALGALMLLLCLVTWRVATNRAVAGVARRQAASPVLAPSR